MTDQRNPSRDPLIDSLLEEVLGGQEPPDLTKRILDAHAKRMVADAQPSSAGSSGRKPKSSRPKYARRLSRYSGWGVASVVVIAASVFAYWAIQEQARFRARNLPPGGALDVPAPPLIVDMNEPPTTFEGQEETTAFPDWMDPNRVREGLRDPIVEKSPSTDTDQVIDAIPSPSFERRATLGQVASDSQVVKFINDQLADGWKRARVSPTKSVDDRTWLARTTQVLVGRKPSAEEAAAFAASRDREQFVEQLLAQDDFARHWAKQFAEILVGAAGSKDFNRLSLENYLVDSLQSNKPFDQLAFELMTAQGSEGQGRSENPAINFILAHRSDGRAHPQAIEKLCQVFLGAQMQCARCHDHPFDSRLKQQTYWEMAAFLTQLRTEETPQGVLVVDRDDAGTDGKSPDDADLFFENAGESGVVAYARFPGDDESIKTGRVEVVNRRVEMAYSVIGSDRFSAAMVNRLWRQVFRHGFTQPVDDMGRHKPASHPKLLSGLAREFRNSEYDLRSALRWMVRSAAFDRQERAKDDPWIAKVGADGFSSFPPQQLISYPEIAQPLMVAASNVHARNPADVLANLGATKQVSPAAAAAARQKINAIHREQLLNARPGSLIDRLTQNRSLSERQAVEHLFYAFVGRQPSDVELSSGEAILDSRPRGEGLIEIGQFILNSREFTKQH